MSFRSIQRLISAVVLVGLAFFAVSCGTDDVTDVVQSGADTVAEAADEMADAADDAMADADSDAEMAEADSDAEMAEADSDAEMADADSDAEMADAEMADDEMAEHSDDEMSASMFPIDVAGITVESRPQRIISLSPTATEMLFAIGAGGQVIAADDYSNFPAEAPTTELSGFTPNIEAIAGYEPDLIVASAPIEGAEVLGVPVLVQFAPGDLSGAYTQIEELGAATGNIGEAAEVVANMQASIDQILGASDGATQGLTYYHELDDTLYSVTSATFIGTVYSELGLVNIADELDADGFGYPQLSEEAILAADPDLIFLADTRCCGQDASTVSARPGWDQLRAVQAGNIVELNDDVASRWGPRIVDLFAEVADAASLVERVS